MTATAAEQLGQWYDRHSPAVLLYARSWVGDDAAADVLHDAFLKLAEQRRPPENVRAWLLTTTRNACITRLRKRKRHRRHHEAIGQLQAEWFEPRSDDLIDGRTARNALAVLDDDLREVILLRIWGQLTLQEIAAVTGTSASTVWQRYQRGIEQMRKRLVTPCKSTTSDSLDPTPPSKRLSAR